MITFRSITKKDYDCVYKLLGQLTKVGNYNKTLFKDYIESLPSNIHIFCICNDIDVIGIGTIFI